MGLSCQALFDRREKCVQGRPRRAARVRQVLARKIVAWKPPFDYITRTSVTEGM